MSSTSADRASAAPSQRRRATWSDWVRISIPVVLLAGLVVAGWRLGYFDLKERDALHEAATRAGGTPWLAPMFVLVYSTLAALAAPVSPLAYGAGAVFGVVEGSILVWTASMIGSAAGYTLARTVWSDSARRLLGRHDDKLRKLRHGNTFLTILRVQLLPVVPFGLLTYAAGTAGLKFLPYWLASGLGIVPSTIAAVYVGDRLRAGVREGSGHPFVVAGAVMAAVLLLSFLPTLIAKRNEQKPAIPEALPSDRHESHDAPERDTPQPQQRAEAPPRRPA
jgi:uncharacterized membrane protein YdjX (TVP38/TMEM64 family)